MPTPDQRKETQEIQGTQDTLETQETPVLDPQLLEPEGKPDEEETQEVRAVELETEENPVVAATELPFDFDPSGVYFVDPKKSEFWEEYRQRLSVFSPAFSQTPPPTDFNDEYSMWVDSCLIRFGNEAESTNRRQIQTLFTELFYSLRKLLHPEQTKKQVDLELADYPELNTQTTFIGEVKAYCFSLSTFGYSDDVAFLINHIMSMPIFVNYKRIRKFFEHDYVLYYEEQFASSFDPEKPDSWIELSSKNTLLNPSKFGLDPNLAIPPQNTDEWMTWMGKLHNLVQNSSKGKETMNLQQCLELLLDVEQALYAWFTFVNNNEIKHVKNKADLNNLKINQNSIIKAVRLFTNLVEKEKKANDSRLGYDLTFIHMSFFNSSDEAKACWPLFNLLLEQ